MTDTMEATETSEAKTLAADRLRSLIERIQRLEEERKGLADDIRDIYSEAKGAGFDAPTIRKVVKLLAMDKADRDEAEMILDTYLHALGVV